MKCPRPWVHLPPTLSEVSGRRPGGDCGRRLPLASQGGIRGRGTDNHLGREVACDSVQSRVCENRKMLNI